MSRHDCLFCRIVAGELPAERVAESIHGVVIRDIDPKAPTHLLVLSRAHITNLNGTAEREVLGDLLLLAARTAEAEGVVESGYRTVINTNGDGGQTVLHLHIHLLGGRALGWPPG